MQAGGEANAEGVGGMPGGVHFSFGGQEGGGFSDPSKIFEAFFGSGAFGGGGGGGGGIVHEWFRYSTRIWGCVYVYKAVVLYMNSIDIAHVYI
jgi:hypothetical protein